MADERAEEQKRHDRVKVVGKAGNADERLDDLAEHKRTAERKGVLKHRAQPADGDDIAAALHIAPAEKKQRKDAEHDAERSQHDEIVPGEAVVIRRVETVAIKEHEVKRGEHDKRISAEQRHAVDKGLQQHLHDHLHDNDDEVQNEVQNGHHRGVPRDHAAQRPETVEKQEAERCRCEEAEAVEGQGQADRGGNGKLQQRCRQIRHKCRQKAGQPAREKKRFPPKRQRGIKIGRDAAEQRSMQHPRQCRAIYERGKRGKGIGVLGEDRCGMVCALRVKGGDEVERQKQQQQAVQRPQRRGTAQLMQKNGAVKAGCS